MREGAGGRGMRVAFASQPRHRRGGMCSCNRRRGIFSPLDYWQPRCMRVRIVPRGGEYARARARMRAAAARSEQAFFDFLGVAVMRARSRSPLARENAPSCRPSSLCVASHGTLRRAQCSSRGATKRHTARAVPRARQPGAQARRHARCKRPQHAARAGAPGRVSHREVPPPSRRKEPR